jgi:hypothetical protein
VRSSGGHHRQYCTNTLCAIHYALYTMQVRPSGGHHR